MVHRITNDVSPLSVAEVRACASTAQEVAEALGVTPSPAQTARLAADLAATPVDERAIISGIEAAARAIVGEPKASVFVTLRLWQYEDHAPQWAYTINPIMLSSGRIDRAEGATPAEALDALRAAVSKARRMADFEARYARERAEIEAADRADKADQDTLPDRFGAAWGKVSAAAPRPTTTNTRDDGEAVTGTLPLTSFGPSGIGGEYQTERGE